MTKLSQNFWAGSLSAQLLGGGSTLYCAELATFAAVTGTDYAELVIDPEGPAPEIIRVTAHTVSSTSATITRAQHGTPDSHWAAGTRILCTVLAGDINIGSEAPITVSGGVDAPQFTVSNEVNETPLLRVDNTVFQDNATGAHVMICAESGSSTLGSIVQIKDHLGAPILYLLNEGGLYVNDNINMVKSIYLRGPGMGWLDGTTNKGAAFNFGSFAVRTPTVVDEDGNTVTITSGYGSYLRPANASGDIATAVSLFFDQDNAQDIGSTLMRARSIYAATSVSVGGTTTVSSGTVTVGGTVITSGSITGATTIGGADVTGTLTAGSLAITSGQLVDGPVTITSGQIAIGALTMTSGTITDGAVAVSPTQVAVGSLAITSGQLALGALTLTSGQLVDGAVTVTEGQLAIGALTLTSGQLVDGPLTITSGQMALGSLTLTSGQAAVGSTTVTSGTVATGQVTATSGVTISTPGTVSIGGRVILASTGNPEANTSGGVGDICISSTGLYMKTVGAGPTGWSKMMPAANAVMTIPMGSLGYTLTATLAAITNGNVYMDQAMLAITSGLTAQWRAVALYTGQNASDVIELDVYDNTLAAAVLTGTATAPGTSVGRVVTAWSNVPSAAVLGYGRARNQTAARGTLRANWLEIRYT